jgi:3-oxoacyl-[acyl-carrier-protein] synthase II
MLRAILVAAKVEGRIALRQVVITGAGVVSPIGVTPAEFERRMFAGESGVVSIRGDLVPGNFPVAAAAPVARGAGRRWISPHHTCGDLPHGLLLLERVIVDGISSIPEGLPVSGVVYGGPTPADGILNSGRAGNGAGGVSWPQPLELIGEILARRGHGPADERDLISINNLTVSSNQAMGMAFHRIRCGLWERVVVAAAYGSCGVKDLMNFHLLGTLSTDQGPAEKVSRPFSASRSGFVLGEGAAALVLEERTAAEQRGATIFGAIVGYATTSDAYRITDGRADVKAASRAIQDAIEDGRLRRDQIDAISAHGTSTRMNDRIETLAIKDAFGPRATGIPVVSLKSQIGHCLAAAGSLEAIACFSMLAQQQLAPTINFTGQDSECDLDYVPNSSRAAVLNRILSNSFGFGGQNSCVVFEKAGQGQFLPPLGA